MHKVKLNIQLFASGTINASSTTMPSGTGKVEWSSSVVSGKNQSTVTAICYCRRTSGTGNYCTVSGSIGIGSQSKSISKYRGSDDKWNTTWKEVGRFTTSVNHDANGTKSIKISFTISADTGGLNGTAKGDGTAILDKINRASKLNAIANFNISDTITISIDKYVTDAVDTLQVKLGDTVIKEVANITDGYQLVFTDDEKTTISNLTSAPQATLLFLLTTMNGDTVLGNSTQTAVATLSSGSYFREIYQKENGKYQVAINGFVNTEINDVLQVYGDNGNLINDNQILWDPGEGKGYYMVGSHTITLSQKVSEQKNGIVLVWQAYSNGAAQTYDFNFTFIPKWQVSVNPSRGVSCFLTDSTAGVIGTKYVYVYDDKIVGNNANGNGATKRNSGITTTNNRWVLTHVLGV